MPSQPCKVISMTNVKLSMVVLVVELYLTSLCFCLSVCLSLTSVTLTTVQGHSSVKKQFQLKISYITIKVKLCMLVNCVI